MPIEPRNQRILFVDDEPGILRGLRKSLRSQRDHWQMTFVDNGDAALDFLFENTMDVIVSDMQMPGMDGAELLEKVRKLSPGTRRIILSGHTKEENIIRTVGPAHIYLAKPCTTEDLVDAIDSIFLLDAILPINGLKSFVSGLKKLPSIPSVVRELAIEIEGAEPSIDKIVDIISRDIAMTSQIIRLTNSAFFALPVKANTLNHAIKLLGLNTTRDIALTAGIIGIFRGDETTAKKLEKLSKNCLVINKLARDIAMLGGLEKNICDQAACSGIVSHLGTLLLQTAKPQLYQQAQKMAEAGEKEIYKREKDLFGASHAELGAYLLGLWGFSLPVIEAVAFHHTPSLRPSRKFDATTALHIAQCIAKGESMAAADREGLLEQLDTQYLKEVGIEKDFPKWLELLQ